MRKRLMILLLITLLGQSFYLNAYAQGPVETVEPIDVYISQVSEEFNVSENLIRSIIFEESRFVVTDNLTQITHKKWFREGFDYCGSDDISNPYVNIRVCGYYLHKWFELYGDGDVYLIVEMWNMGEQNALVKHNVNKPKTYAKNVVNRADKWDLEKDREIWER